jgi:hypothetical protein
MPRPHEGLPDGSAFCVSRHLYALSIEAPIFILMDFKGSITFTIETEDDVVLAAQLIQQKRASFHQPIPEPPATEVKPVAKEGKHSRMLTDAEIIDELKLAFPQGAFFRAQADAIIEKATGLSTWTAGRILNKAIDEGKLKRLKQGEFTFDSHTASSSKPQNKKKRNISEKHRSHLRTLQNPVLYLNFMRKLKALNPEGIDEQLIDRNLEPQEALNDLKKKYPNLILYKYEEERDIFEEFRGYLDELGIDNPKVQELVVARMESADPFTDEELKAFAKAQQQVAIAVNAS